METHLETILQKSFFLLSLPDLDLGIDSLLIKLVVTLVPIQRKVVNLSALIQLHREQGSDLPVLHDYCKSEVVEGVLAVGV